MKRKGCIRWCVCCDDDDQNNNHVPQGHSLLPYSNDLPPLRPTGSNRIKSCKLHKVTIGIFVTFGLMLSIFSSADCRFLRVDVGFKPDNSIYGSEEFGLGLWSMEDPTAPGKCLMTDVSRMVGSITREDHYYSSYFFNGDIIWGTARIIALSGVVCGLVAMVIIWVLIFSLESSQDPRTETLLYFSLLPFLCEGVKFGLFFSIEPCTSQLWEQNNTAGANAVNVIERYEADQCYMDRSTYFSLGACVCYFLLVVCLIASVAKPDYTHRVMRRQTSEGSGMAFDDISMPSYLGSIGVSVESHTTRNTLKSSSSSNPQMVPIIEKHSVGLNRSTSLNSSSISQGESKSNLYSLAEHSSEDSSEDSSSEEEDDDDDYRDNHRQNRRGSYR